jgi:hypothetical protein
VQQQPAVAEEQRDGDGPRHPERGQQPRHRREVGRPQRPAPGGHELRDAGDGLPDAGDDTEGALLQQGEGEPGVGVGQPGREVDRRAEGALRLVALARVEPDDAPLHEAEAHLVEAGDVPLHPDAADLAQRPLLPLLVPGAVGPDEARPEVLERRLAGRRRRRRRLGRLRREREQQAEREPRAQAPPVRVFSM